MGNLEAALISTPMIQHPDLLELPRGVRYLYVEALVWSRLHLTDGFIPAHMPRHISDEPDLAAAIRSLVDAGRWLQVEGGWVIVGFLDTQMSAERIAKRRASSRERFDRFIAGGGRKKPRRSQRVSNASSNGSDPTRPDPPRKGKVGVAGGEATRGRSLPPAEERRAAAMKVLAEPRHEAAERAARRALAELEDDPPTGADDPP